MPNTDDINPYATCEPIENLDPASVPALSPPQRVRFLPSIEGTIEYNFYRTLRNQAESKARRQARRTLLLLSLPMFLIGGILLKSNLSDGEPAAVILPVLILLCGAWLVSLAWRANRPEAIRASLRRSLERLRMEEGAIDYFETEYLIDQQGVSVEDEHEVSRCSWRGVTQVVIEPHYLFLIRSPLLAAHAIPRSAFPSQHAYLGFANLAHQLWRQHGPQDPQGT